MANNQYVNKVVYDGTTLIDITDTTATASDVAQGVVFYKADGTRSVGTATSGGITMDLLWTNPNQTSTMTDNTNISIDLTNYEWLSVIFVPSLSGTTIANYNYQVQLLKKGFKQELSYSNNSIRANRTFTVDNNGVLVGAGLVNGATNPGAFVPMYVYGL